MSRKQVSVVRLDRQALIAALRDWQSETFSLDAMSRIIEHAAKTDAQRTSYEQKMINERTVKQLSHALGLKLLPIAKLIRHGGRRNSDADRVAQWWRTVQLLRAEIWAEAERRRQNCDDPEALVPSDAADQMINSGDLSESATRSSAAHHHNLSIPRKVVKRQNRRRRDSVHGLLIKSDDRLLPLVLVDAGDEE